jgi:hypothetical protein
MKVGASDFLEKLRAIEARLSKKLQTTRNRNVADAAR